MITREEALERTQGAIKEHGLDALVAASPANVRYTAGTSFMTQRTVPDRLALVSMTASGEPVFIYCAIEEGHAQGESWLSRLRGYTEFAEKPVEVLAEVLREQGAADGRIGVEERYLVHRDHELLRRALPTAQLIAADEIFDHMRAIKTPSEVKLLGDAARETDAAIRAAFSSVAAGMTEREVAEKMLEEGRSRGGEKLLHQVLATGGNGFKTHAEPGDTPLQPGDVLRTDFGMTWSGGYNSDIGRTAFVSPLRPHQKELYRKLEEVHQAVIAAMQPGVPVSEVYAMCRLQFSRVGADFRMP